MTPNQTQEAAIASAVVFALLHQSADVLDVDISLILSGVVSRGNFESVRDFFVPQIRAKTDFVVGANLHRHVLADHPREQFMQITHRR